ncbi:MANSC domain-containing protein 4-like [Colossoma macropomum]|uniref:MANSC domain-containing protein 4-like n=1 Tax=Colossoma macropomum TaxID=42526 RepID=UPI0018651D1F|nr:MANSC domain-containing protein 4-like [Colossoma macropomum]
MTIAWIVLWLFSWLKQADPVCSPTSYYRNCWIRRFPGLYIAVEESERRGAALLQLYQEESALQCSRACCLAANFSCNLAVYHYNTTQDSANCFHLHCPTLESCILRQRGNVILYNVTKGVDPDLLVFGKHFTSNFQVLPNHASSRVNVSEPFASDKRQFNRPHMVPSSSTHPATPATSTSTSTISPTSEVPVSTSPVSTDSTHNIPPAPSIQRSTLRSPTQPSATQVIANHSPHPTTTASTKWASTAPQSTLRPSSVFYTSQNSLTLPSQPPSTAKTVSSFPSQPTPGSTYQPTTTTWASTTASTTGETTLASTTAPTTSQTMVASTKEFVTSQTTMASTTSQTAWASTTASPASHTSSTTFITLSSSNSTTLNSKPTTTPLISTQQNTTDKTSVHSTLATVQLNSTNAASALTPLTTLKTTTTQPQMPGSQATIAWPYLQPTNTISSNPTVAEGGNTQSPTTDGQVDTSTNGTTTEHSTTSSGSTTSTTLSSPPAASVTTSLTTPTSMEDSQPYPNDTKGYISRNITTGDSPRPGGDGGLTPVWHLAANTVLVALATCATIAFGCCCSVLMAVSWRGRRRRKGRYRTTLRGKSGSMRLIKYVIVRESS